MRLIDADKAISVLQELREHSLTGRMDIDNAIYLLEYSPTAYNVDKVSGELLVEHQRYDHIFDSTLDAYDLGKSHAYREASDIVMRR